MSADRTEARRPLDEEAPSPLPGVPAVPWTPARGGARRFIARLLLIVDVVAAILAVVLGGLARVALDPWLTESFVFDPVGAAVLVPSLVAGLAVAGCYRPAAATLGSDTFRRYLRGTALDVLVIGFVSFALRLQPSRLYVAFVAVLLLGLGMLFRWRARRVLERSGLRLATRAIVVGTDEASRHVAASIGTSRPGGYEVVGLVGRDGSTQEPPDPTAPDRPGTPPVLGGIEDLDRILADVAPDAVVASTSSLAAEELRALYLELEPTDVELVVYPSLVEVAARRLDVEAAGSLPLLHLSKVRLTTGRRVAKRALDLVVAATLGVLGAPLLLAAVVAIRRDSPGPVLFSQTRIGQDGEPFRMWKLRTMVLDAEGRRSSLEAANEVGPGLFKLRDDPRITAPGRRLRRWSIDELPQLWNVLRGEMSMVGPRPALPDEVATREAGGARRVRLKPGLTGFWQVSGRSDLDADEALRLDLFYVENWSLAFDLLILLRTIRAVASARGAY